MLPNKITSRMRNRTTTPEFSKAQRQRKKVEALFAELKNHIAVRRLRLRRLNCSEAVLAGSDGSERQATGSVSQSADNTCSGTHSSRRGKTRSDSPGIKKCSFQWVSTPTALFSVVAFN
ncbi:MAG: transposase [Acidobacteria bacterium]|nr:transposase [Acidobacteriota bacterium]